MTGMDDFDWWADDPTFQQAADKESNLNRRREQFIETFASPFVEGEETRQLVYFFAAESLWDDRMLADDLPLSPSGKGGGSVAVNARVANGEWWLRLGKVSDIRMNVLFGLMANFLTNNPPLALTASVFAAFWNNVRRLSDEEIEVIAVLRRLLGNRLYSTWVVEQTLLDALPPDDKVPSTRNLLATMASRGILENEGGMWRAVK